MTGKYEKITYVGEENDKIGGFWYSWEMALWSHGIRAEDKSDL